MLIRDLIKFLFNKWVFLQLAEVICHAVFLARLISGRAFISESFVSIGRQGTFEITCFYEILL